MAERNPIFELHIRPMFRLLDRRHMLRIQQDRISGTTIRSKRTPPESC